MPQHSIQLESPFGRIRLLPPSANDDETAAWLRTHPETLRHLPVLPVKATPEDVRTRRESRAEDPTICDFHIHFKQADGSYKFAGMSGYFNLNEGFNSCEVGILISPEIHRGGYATESLYTLLKWIVEERKIHRITFETGKDNASMRNWLEKVLGAVLEATKRDAWRDVNGSGEYFDVCTYSLLDKDWTEGAEERLRKRLGSIGA